MKTLILAGGYGSRLGNLTQNIPKPMVPVGDKPIIWHIMKLYSFYGFRDFIVLLGYQGVKIKEYFKNYRSINQNFTINLADGSLEYLDPPGEEDWKITLVDTGLKTLKGGRIKRVESLLTDETNMITYGDGVSDVNINKLLEYHESHGKILTVTGVRPPSRFGELNIRDNEVTSFEEKPQVSAGIINGGFMVFNRKLLDYLTPEENCDFEFGVLEDLAGKGEIQVFRHDGFWECVDTERDLNYLNKLWFEKKAFWKIWRS